MRLTTFSDYSLRVLMYLALQDSRRATIQEVAAAYAISENHLMKVVRHLARGGFVHAVRGKGGGLSLARDPQAIRVGDVLRSTEPAQPMAECMPGGANACNIASVCRLSGVLDRAVAAMYAELDRHTLAQLVARPVGLRQVLWPHQAQE